MNLIAPVQKHLKIYRRQKYAYVKAMALLGRLYAASQTEAETIHLVRKYNRYRNYAMGIVHCSVPQVRMQGVSVW